MYSESDIDEAVGAGAITPAAAAALRGHVAAAHTAPAVDEEHFRLLTGFNDIFVSIAVVLLLVAVAQIGMSIAYALGGLFVAAAAWALAEFFTARRRMALPSILLLLAFVGGVVGTAAGVLEAVAPHVHGRTGALAAAGIALCGALAAAAHWRRFMVPITVAAGTAALVATSIGLLMAAVPAIGGAIYPLLLVAGIAVFAVAMRWDMADRERRTRKADVAFWLHLVAAPLIAHSVFNLLGVFGNDIGIGVALVVLMLYFAFAFVALAVDSPRVARLEPRLRALCDVRAVPQRRRNRAECGVHRAGDRVGAVDALRVLAPDPAGGPSVRWERSGSGCRRCTSLRSPRR